MVFVLETLPKRALFASFLAAATLAFAFPVWSVYVTDSLSRQGTREALEQAITYQPDNAVLHNRIGRMHLEAPGGDIRQAIASLERAVALDSQNGTFWVDLGLAREQAGDISAAAAAFQQARRVDPRTPAHLWVQANFDLRHGRRDRAVAMFTELLHESPEYTSRALPLLAHLIDFPTMVDRVVPLHINSLAAVLEFVRREELVAHAGRAWARILASATPFPAGSIRPFLDWLIHSGEGRLAERVWSDAARRGWIPVDPHELSQPLYNAGFRQSFVNYGFDWRVLPHPEASVWIEGRGARPGQESLCVQFADGARSDFWNVVHFLPVAPNYEYALRANLRSERLVSRPGAFLQVASAALQERSTASTEAVVGTSAWKEVSLKITTPPNAQVAQIALVRPAPTASEEPASGLVCISGVEWKPLGPVWK